MCCVAIIRRSLVALCFEYFRKAFARGAWTDSRDNKNIKAEFGLYLGNNQGQWKSVKE